MSARDLTVLVAMCVVWGLHFVVIKTASDAVPPIFYAALRMTLVALLLSPFLRWRPGRMRTVLAAGVCYGGLNYSLMFTGISMATASAASVAIELYAPFATILSVVFLGEKVGWRRVGGIALAFAGVTLIALGKNGAPGDESRAALGVGLVACAALTEACGSILVKSTNGFRPHELLAWFGVIGTIILWSATALFERGQVAAFDASNKAMLAGAVVYSAIGASIFGHTAYYWLLQRLPVSQVSPSALLVTLFAVGFSVLLLGEPFTLRFFIGGAMALTGVGVILFRSAKRPIVEPGAPEAGIVAGAQDRPLEKQA
ncbi:MAG: EamA family transporter [Pseudomonadota bacterium]|nr:EamA family transporter [Pseudomonadota bacterium]